jgi:hypothetical protein
MKRALRKTKEKAIEKGKWPGHAGPRRGGDVVQASGAQLSMNKYMQLQPLVIE